MALTNKLSNIATAIREKTGTTELMTLDEMPEKIAGISGGSGGECTKHHIPDEALVISGNCQRRFAYSGWDWYISECGSEITTKDISNGNRMFDSSNLPEIPFVLNIDTSSGKQLDSCFSSAKITNAPKVNVPNAKCLSINGMFESCNRVRDLNGVFLNEDNFIDSWCGYKNTGAFSGHSLGGIFYGCSSLRSVPSWFKRLVLNPESTSYPYTSYCIYNRNFCACLALDDITDLPVWKCAAVQTSNMFDTYTFEGCSRIKDFTFATNEDGTPITTEWKSQTINLNNQIGYVVRDVNITGFSAYHGITTATRVTDDASYQALKDSPDWWTTDVAYSRYNHDSAVRTINSLPDTSAYLASAGGTNTIKFKGAAGSATDGGAINTLTPEEISIAAAKGWTVTLV